MPYVRNVVRPAPKMLSPSDQQLVLRVTGDHVDGFRDHCLFSVALGTGLRETEILALDVGDVVGPGGAIRGKISLRRFKGSDRESAAPPATEQRVFVPKLVRLKLLKFIVWKRRRREDVRARAPLFVSRFGTRLSARQLRTAWGVWQRRAGIEQPITFHGLRHTSLSNLYKRTRDLLLVQQQARHAHAATTEIYAHVTDEDIRSAVEELPA